MSAVDLAQVLASGKGEGREGQIQALIKVYRNIDEIENILKANYALQEDINIDLAISVTVPGNSEATITYRVKSGFDAYIERVFIDNRPDTEFQINVGNISIPTNEFEWSKPKYLQKGDLIQFIIGNLDASSREYIYFLTGWGRIKERNRGR